MGRRRRNLGAGEGGRRPGEIGPDEAHPLHLEGLIGFSEAHDSRVYFLDTGGGACGECNPIAIAGVVRPGMGSLPDPCPPHPECSRLPGAGSTDGPTSRARVAARGNRAYGEGAVVLRLVPRTV